MSNTLPASSQNLSHHRNRLTPSSTISAIRHVRFRRPNVDHGRRGKKIITRRREEDELDDVDGKSEISLEENVRAIKKIGWKQRLKHFTWTWFTMTMATGGIANVMCVSF